MFFLKKQFPTINKVALWLWESPTFTNWGNQGVQSLRFLLVTPLILTRFDQTEIAAWYLFASLNFMGAILAQRIGLTFSRMFAFAMGGASDLSPIKGKRAEENGGQPNWAAFSRAYGTIGSLNLMIAVMNVLLAFGMGWFGLSNILEDYSGSGPIWLAFSLMQASAFFGYVFQRYGIALAGMNFVALANRWNMVFSMLSVLAGSLVLVLGGGMVALVVIMQVFSVIGIIRSRYLLSRVEDGRVLGLRAYAFDKQVARWCWPPTWKGFVGQFGMLGSIRLTAIIYTSFASKVEAASLLFAFANIQTITQIAQTPFGAVQPLMSRQLAKGEINELAKLVRQRMALSLGMVALGVIVFGLLIPPLLELIGSNIPYISLEAWLLLGGLTLVQRFDILCCAVSATGNEMIYYWETAIAAVFGALALFFMKDFWGVCTPILTSILPGLMLMHIGPLKKSAQILRQPLFSNYLRDFSATFLVFVLLSLSLAMLT